MKLKFKRLLALAGGLAAMATVNAQSIPAFRAGERVAFLGNSITDGGHYHSYIWLYYMTRFPGRRITCYNVGVGGDNVKQMHDRFEKEVVTKKPTVMTLTWGMNDSGYFEWFGKDADHYAVWTVDSAKARYNRLDKDLKRHPEIKKIFILGSPYDATTKSNKQNYYPGKITAFQQLIDFQKNMAQTNGWSYVDFDHPMMAINKQWQAKDSLFSLTPNDRIHPDNDGHMVMAYLFLKAQGLSGKPVADFSVNAASGKVIKAENCTISKVATTNNGVRFDYLAGALPYPLDTVSRGPFQRKTQAEGMRYVPFMQEFNKELLTIKGLKQGNYKLLMDGQEVNVWTEKQLEAGVNLAEQVYTPEYQQALAVMHLNEERWTIENKTRGYSFVQFNVLKPKGLLYADNKAAMDVVENESKTNPFVRGNRDTYIKGQYKAVRDGWQHEQDALIDAIYAANQPKVHQVELVRVP
ncbi:SGNH/GDSL hydrolase family protein [Mucilaginibacter lacusdianchii]|uniref:SGNH/GDSL hydrolase family protein n=1 Tax=Mucilaginibacter lacusdianchii TaxID=2684211 RepID=UPI00131E20D3|nr:SGNH/GDSL hydrolase family protein [Mucilaginibacter sp. JXJ CY 39]